MKSIEGQTKKAIKFVLNNRDSEGMWKNFLSRTHGESTDWVTSFSGLNLLEAGVSRNKLKETANSVLKRQREGGGFSYNHKIVPDLDSTAFAIRFLEKAGHSQKLENSREFIKQHQNLDGGFGTEQCPYDIQSIADLQKIPHLLSNRGYSEHDIEKICHKNWIGFLEKNWQ